ncbi:MAG: HAMP domain-containing protein [Actinomycetes bacterium]|jgi:methyl-accepting chemotaxis protein
MSAAAPAVAAAVTADTSAAPQNAKIRFGMRAKMLTAFAVAFSIIFGILTYFVIQFVTDQAQTKLVTQLRETAVGGSSTLDATGLQTLLTNHPAYDANNLYPQSDPLYVAANQQLQNIRSVVPNASPYTYTLNPTTGKLEWMTSYSALSPDPPFTNSFRGPVSGVVNAETYKYLEAGLKAPTDQPSYTDANGSWISTYVPITAKDGSVVGGLAVDYPLSYVDEVRAAAIRNIVPLLVIAYLLLTGLVLLVSTWLTRPLKRLTAATRRIASGDYDVDLSNVVVTRIPDEMGVLAASFAVMVDKVRIREKDLTQQVKRLTVEIDSKKREQSVSEITDSDFFSALTAKAGNMRRRMRELEESEGSAAGSPSPA